MQAEYDIIVVGAGSGGLSVSLSTARFGLKTLLIDKTDKHIGGDCLNYGCVPSKALSVAWYQCPLYKIYPYPVSGRVNQSLIVRHREKMLTGNLKKLLKVLLRLLD